MGTQETILISEASQIINEYFFCLIEDTADIKKEFEEKREIEGVCEIREAITSFAVNHVSALNELEKEIKAAGGDIFEEMHNRVGCYDLVFIPEILNLAHIQKGKYFLSTEKEEIKEIIKKLLKPEN
ncbi:MAG: hypothetical protein ACRBCS_15960 [Cellvibrionaceae bacterium]